MLVVGFGCAGAAAAIEARAAGADVAVLERASGGGGTSAMSGGVLYLGGGTSLQKACGFEDSAEDMFRYLMASCGDAPDEEKMRRYCEGSVAHFEWVKAQGCALQGDLLLRNQRRAAHRRRPGLQRLRALQALLRHRGAPHRVGTSDR